MTFTVPDWVTDYVGIPFKDAGRERPAVDCYGLLRLIQLEVFNKTIPLCDDYRSTSREQRHLASKIDSMKGSTFIPTSKPSPGDAVLVKSGNFLAHIVTYAGWDLGRELVLETTKDHGHSRLENIRGFDLKGAELSYFKVEQ